MYNEHAEVRNGTKTKDRVNQRKHGFGFRIAARARWHALGMVGGRVLLMVVHVYREAENGEEIVRIISARKANKRESRVYFR
jgi:uncharacterized protein